MQPVVAAHRGDSSRHPMAAPTAVAAAAPSAESAAASSQPNAPEAVPLYKENSIYPLAPSSAMSDRKYVPALADLKAQTMKLRSVPGYLFWQVRRVCLEPDPYLF